MCSYEFIFEFSIHIVSMVPNMNVGMNKLFIACRRYWVSQNAPCVLVVTCELLYTTRVFL